MVHTLCRQRPTTMESTTTPDADSSLGGSRNPSPRVQPQDQPNHDDQLFTPAADAKKAHLDASMSSDSWGVPLTQAEVVQVYLHDRMTGNFGHANAVVKNERSLAPEPAQVKRWFRGPVCSHRQRWSAKSPVRGSAFGNRGLEDEVALVQVSGTGNGPAWCYYDIPLTAGRDFRSSIRPSSSPFLPRAEPPRGSRLFLEPEQATTSWPSIPPA